MFYYPIWIGFVSSFSAFVETTIPSQGGVHRHLGVVMAGVEAEMLQICSAGEEGKSAGIMGGVWEGAGDSNGLGGGRSGRSRLDVGTRLKGEAMTGNGLGGDRHVFSARGV